MGSPAPGRGRERVSRVVDGIYPARVRPAGMRAAGGAGSDYGSRGTPDWRSIDWREHVRRVEVAGRSVTYVDLGDPQSAEMPVLFVHGLGGNWQNWLENIPAAAQDRRVVALDLPGFGFSEMPLEEISISGYGRLVDEFCERVELDAAAVVGNSMGGFISAEVAISFPERVERLVLVSAAGISITSLRRQPLLTIARYSRFVGAAAAGRSRQVASRARLRHGLLGAIMRHPSLLPPDTVNEILAGAGRPGFLDALDALMDYDFRDRLPGIGCPTLIVWGDKDMLVPLRDADEFERLIPDARKVILEDTGHVPMLERAETFNGCLRRFLEEMGEARDNLPGAAASGGAQNGAAPEVAEPTVSE